MESKSVAVQPVTMFLIQFAKKKRQSLPPNCPLMIDGGDGGGFAVVFVVDEICCCFHFCGGGGVVVTVDFGCC